MKQDHFKIIKKSKKSFARLGILKTNHGLIKTPFFMPIATYGAVKNLTSFDLKKINTQIILANTFHLHLRPSDKLIKKFKGLHNFMNWPFPILTDSGGFQIFSLAKIRKINREGVVFNSPFNGQKILLTPEKAIQIQTNLNSDILMVLDWCLHYTSNFQETEKAVNLTTYWAEKSKKEFLKLKNKNLLFGIIQGGIFKSLREKSLKEIISLDFDGYAIGGLAVGEPVKKMFQILDFLKEKLPTQKPHYLMGVGYPEQILEAVKFGIDMFDCVIPTRHARHGELFIKKKEINQKNFYSIIKINKTKYKSKKEPIDKNCKCETCLNYSLAYLHHLYKIKELLYFKLATIHNLKFYLDFMAEIREKIKNNQI